MTDLQKRLFALQDPEYRAFQLKLTPGLPPESVIGVRAPEIKKLARQLRGTEEGAALLGTLPHRYYEENNIHGLLICGIKDFTECVRQLNIFLPYVNNWATCDTLRPLVFARFPEAAEAEILRWMRSEHLYTVRFAIEMLMTYYLDAHFRPEHLQTVASVRTEEYYVNMMIAWYFATALAKRWAETVPYLESPALEPRTRGKAIQKALESRRISEERKAYLRTLRRP